MAHPENQPSTPSPAPKPKASQQRVRVALAASAVLALLAVANLRGGTPAGDTVPLSELETRLVGGDVKKLELLEGSQQARLTLDDDTTVSAYIPSGYADTLVEQSRDAGVETDVSPNSGPGMVAQLVFAFLPTLLFLGLMFLIMRKVTGGITGIGRMKSGKDTPVAVPETRFKDVAGCDEVVEELREVVEILHDPGKFEKTGARVPKGVLLVGPAGTGKTLLARAVAGEAGVPFFAVSGSEFVEVFAGVGASRVRQIFAKAREAGKAIIFIDEIDAIGRARSGGALSGGMEERESTLNQMLVEMDGFSKSGVVILAATNRPDVLDPALLRPGRFDRKIVVPAPDRRGRVALLGLYAKDKPFAHGIDWDQLAGRIAGMSGAEIAQLINEAALEAGRNKQGVITAEHLETALQTTVLGRERKSAVLSERDRNIVAWHEAGHTVIALCEEHAAAPVTVTIVPRGAAGGVTWMEGNDHDFLTRSQAIAQLTVAMGGRAAEEILMDGDYTQGAHGDLDAATRLATEMIGRYGMGRKLVSRQRANALGETDKELENEAAELIGEALDRARSLLAANRALLEAIVAKLLAEETVTREQLEVLRAEHTCA